MRPLYIRFSGRAMVDSGRVWGYFVGSGLITQFNVRVRAGSSGRVQVEG